MIYHVLIMFENRCTLGILCYNTDIVIELNQHNNTALQLQLKLF